jgi:hypothetical protein
MSFDVWIYLMKNRDFYTVFPDLLVIILNQGLVVVSMFERYREEHSPDLYRICFLAASFFYTGQSETGYGSEDRHFPAC